MKLYVPANLNIDNLTPAELSGEMRDRFHDRIAYFCDTLINSLKSKKVFDKFIDTGFIPLMKVYLRNIMGDQTNDILKVLEDSQIILVDPSVKRGIKSRGYVLQEEYRSGPLKRVELRSYLVKKTLRVRKESIGKKQTRLKAKIPNVIKQLRGNPWSIAVDEAETWIELFENQLYRKISASTFIPQELKSDTISKYQHYYQFVRIQLKLIRDGIWNAIVDEKNGRLHTSITNLPRPLRHFMLFNEEDDLIGLDIRNSQPFLMSYMSNPKFWSTATKRKDCGIKLMELDKRVHNRILSRDRDERREIIKMIEVLETHAGSGIAGLNFSCLVREGRFYETIMENFKGKYSYRGQLRFNTRDATKTEVLRLMYFDTRKSRAPFYAPFRRFERLFPLESRIMKLFKRDNYKEFPVLLQKLESKLVLDYLGRNLREIPFLTIHDSVIIQSRHEIRVREIVDDVFRVRLGFVPRVEKTVYNPISADKDLNNYVHEKLHKMELKFCNNMQLTSDDMSNDLPDIDN